jgi:hypothetical protein
MQLDEYIFPNLCASASDDCHLIVTMTHQMHLSLIIPLATELSKVLLSIHSLAMQLLYNDLAL